MRDDSRLKIALDYAKTGWPVFPVGENKLPAIKAWEKEATTDPARIRGWYQNIFLGGCNFGFCPGRAGIAVIDLDVGKHIDGKKVNGADSLAAFAKANGVQFPATYTVQTPSGGRHLYFRAAGIRSKNAFLPAVDVKSCGGFVLIPGSRIDKGMYVLEYMVEKNLSVKDMPPEFLAIYGHKKTEKVKSAINYNTQITPDTPDKIEAAQRIIEDWPEAPEGDRNNQLFQLMRELCKAGVSEKRAAELYAEEALPKIGLDPDTAEVSATIHSAYADLSDLGSESEEGRRLAVRLFDDLPDDATGGKPENFGADWTELEKREVPERRWFIENWLSADEGYTVLFSGRGGTGKSALMLDLARSLATGEPFCGMEVKRGGRCLYVGCEDSEEELARRIQKRSKLGGAVPQGVIRLVSRLGKENLLCSSDRSGKLKEEPFYKVLREQAKAFFGVEGGVLILDTAADFFAGNEIDRSQVSQFVKGLLNRLGKEVGVTIILLAHPSKKQAADGQGYSGSTAWEGAFRCRWELNYKDPGKVDGLLELVLAKSNTTKAGRKITLENTGGMFAPVDSAKADESAKNAVFELIAEAWRDGCPFGKGPQSERPITKALIPDPVVPDAFLSEVEIRDIRDKLLTEKRIEYFKTNKQRGLRPAERTEE